MANYNSYFHHDNPKFLRDKFSREERMNRKEKIIKDLFTRGNTFLSGQTYEKTEELTFKD